MVLHSTPADHINREEGKLVPLLVLLYLLLVPLLLYQGELINRDIARVPLDLDSLAS
jgi:hypothetical protein